MPTTGDLRKALTYDKNLTQNLDNAPKNLLPKSNPYYAFVESQRQMVANTKSAAKTKEELTLKAVAPKFERTNLATPKIKLVGPDPTLKASPPKTKRTRPITPKTAFIKRAGFKTRRYKRVGRKYKK
jgi:hypothetical protein